VPNENPPPLPEDGAGAGAGDPKGKAMVDKPATKVVCDACRTREEEQVGASGGQAETNAYTTYKIYREDMTSMNSILGQTPAK
jgi:hypothetical protein